jgi:uncharacterized protein (DUF302 family)
MRALAVVDHAAAAHAVGLTLPATQVIIFGKPKAGTPLMQAAPEIAIDVPLRVLVHDEQLAPLATPGSLVAAVLDRH